jgi:hypothetical protein
MQACDEGLGRLPCAVRALAALLEVFCHVTTVRPTLSAIDVGCDRELVGADLVVDRTLDDTEN